MNIEDVFSSRLRMKILRVLTEVGELNVSEIAHKLNVNYAATNKHLKMLENEEIVQRKMFGRIRLYRLNEHSPKTKAIKNLIDTWEHANEQ